MQTKDKTTGYTKHVIHVAKYADEEAYAAGEMSGEESVETWLDPDGLPVLDKALIAELEARAVESVTVQTKEL